ncbi:hypothetical protein LY78DRAFT_132028 [Colletotrichum sublineola]|nr:hypothetical protein LY78DRAFT_132028 [Colletotrichum sublineola]
MLKRPGDGSMTFSFSPGIYAHICICFPDLVRYRRVGRYGMGRLFSSAYRDGKHPLAVNGCFRLPRLGRLDLRIALLMSEII